MIKKCSDKVLLDVLYEYKVKIKKAHGNTEIEKYSNKARGALYLAYRMNVISGKNCDCFLKDIDDWVNTHWKV